ncbi:hypothetical protein [Agromyces sp. LHK192]|uniref:hypothetical protein n=1 Tax=Agromyces sp. LHK192 TaxID=2498704 RepID=UPI0035142B5F
MLNAISLPVELNVVAGGVTLRRADADDLTDLMRLLSDDPISAGRGDLDAAADRPLYAEALTRIIGIRPMN